MIFNNILKPLFISLALTCSSAASEITPEGTNYTYKQRNEVKQEIEIHFPKGHEPKKSKTPAIIMFHGGSWVKGDKDQFRDLCHYFASRGIVAATANYQLSTKKAGGKSKESVKRICITDAKSAIRWYKQNAETLGIDPERIIVGGASAGGHICLLATNNPGLNDPKDPLEYNTNAAAYMLFNPALATTDKDDSEVNFHNYLKPNLPPTLVFFGSQDRWLKGWNAAYKKIQTLNVQHFEYLMANDQPHGFFNKQPWGDITLRACDHFLVNHGFLENEPTVKAPLSGEVLVKVP